MITYVKFLGVWYFLKLKTKESENTVILVIMVTGAQRKNNICLVIQRLEQGNMRNFIRLFIKKNPLIICALEKKMEQMKKKTRTLKRTV